MKFVAVFVTSILLASNVVAEQSSESILDLDQRVVDIKREMLDLGKDMHIFERFRVFPDDTRLSLFLAMDVGEFFTLDSVKIKLDDKVVVEQLFHHHESTGFERGAAFRVHVGNYDKGRHNLVAFFTGTGPRGRAYKRGLEYKIDKGDHEAFVELRISDREQRLQPEFLVKQWAN